MSSSRGNATVLALVAALAFAPAAVAGSPQLDLALPRGGTRGRTVELVLQGQRIADARSLLFYRPGVTATALAAIDATRVKATVAIAADCPLGEHPFRLVCASGTSELRTFWVGAMQTLDEAEPNDRFDAPQAVELDRTIHGRLTPEDIDYFAFTAAKGERVTVEVEGVRLAGAFYDPQVSILDARRFELAFSDDTALLGADPIASVVIPADGRYVVAIRDAAFGGDPNAWYRLHVGRFPRPLAVLPAGAEPAKAFCHTLFGDAGGEMGQLHVARGAASGFEELWVSTPRGVSPSPLRLAVGSRRPIALEREPNNGPKQARACSLAYALHGLVDPPGDTDWFQITVAQGETLALELAARSLGSPLDPVLTIHGSDGKYVAGNDDGAGLDSRVRWQAPAGGVFFLRVADHRGRGGPTFSSRLELASDAPGARLSIPPIARNSQALQEASVPRGGRMAVLLQAERTGGHGGPIALALAGLPAGVVAQLPELGAGRTLLPIVLEAAADAPAGAGKVELACRVPGGAPLAGGFLQRTPLLVGAPNDSVYHELAVDRLACAVTDRAPFALELVPPKAPLVLGGAGRLVVRVHRPEGAPAAPIHLRMLYNPPGTSSPGEVVVQPAQGVIDLPVSAAGNAEVGSHPIAVVGWIELPTGAVWTSSAVAALEVAAPMLAIEIGCTVAIQGQAVKIPCAVAVTRPFAGRATARLIGLPPGIEAAPQPIEGTTTAIAFDVATQAGTPCNRYRNLCCQVVVDVEGDPVVHNGLGAGELRVDPPPPAPAAAPAAPPPPPPPPEPAAAPPPRPLSRLEQLRLEAKEKAAREGVKR